MTSIGYLDPISGMSSAPESTTTEFAVELTCQKCVDKTQKVLSGVDAIQDFRVNLQSQSVLVTSTLPSSKLLELIESTGKRAVIMGSSGAQQQAKSASAVAMLGGLIGCGSIQVGTKKKDKLQNLTFKSNFCFQGCYSIYSSG